MSKDLIKEISKVELSNKELLDFLKAKDGALPTEEQYLLHQIQKEIISHLQTVVPLLNKLGVAHDLDKKISGKLTVGNNWEESIEIAKTYINAVDAADKSKIVDDLWKFSSKYYEQVNNQSALEPYAYIGKINKVFEERNINLKIMTFFPNDRFDTTYMEVVEKMSPNTMYVKKILSFAITESGDYSKVRILKRAQVVTT